MEAALRGSSSTVAQHAEASMDVIPDWARELEATISAASEARDAALRAQLDKIQAELDAGAVKRAAAMAERDEAHCIEASVSEGLAVRGSAVISPGPSKFNEAASSSASTVASTAASMVV